MMTDAAQKKMHFELTNVGLRAQATAAGLLQLCKELQRANILNEDAVGRIKAVIAHEIEQSAPRISKNDKFRKEIKERLDSLFSENHELGGANNLSFATNDPCDEHQA